MVARVLQPGWELVLRRNLARQLPVGEHDLVVGTEHDPCRVAEELVSVDPDTERLSWFGAEPADAGLAQPNAPDSEELAKVVVVLARRLLVDDPGRVVRVERRQTVELLSPDVEADEARNGNVLAVVVDVEVRVRVHLERLLREAGDPEH